MHSFENSAETNHVNANHHGVDYYQSWDERLIFTTLIVIVFDEQIPSDSVHECRSESVGRGVAELHMLAVFDIEVWINHKGPWLSKDRFEGLWDEAKDTQLRSCYKWVCLILEMVRNL